MILFLDNFLKKIATDNPLIFGGYGWGDFYKKWSGGTIEYPYLNAFSLNKTMNKGLTILDITLSVCDIVREDESNLLEVENSTLNTIRDVYNLFKIELNKSNYTISENINATFFTNRGGDNVAGHYVVIQVSYFQGLDLCNNVVKINPAPPITVETFVNLLNKENDLLREVKVNCGETTPLTIGNSTVIVQDFDGNFVETIDILAEGNKVYKLPEVLPCLPVTYTVEYDSGTPIESGSEPSGGNILVKVPDCPTFTPVQTDINGIPFSNLGSGASQNIVVEDSDGLSVGSIVGGKVVVDACPNNWELQFIGTNDLIAVNVTLANQYTFTSEIETSTGNVTYSADGTTFVSITFPFTPTVGLRYFKRPTRLVTGTYILNA
jgi:hypothetical protein